ncbi:MAG: T9SS type A sorting domain-containing protein [Lentimicrobium sp.]
MKAIIISFLIAMLALPFDGFSQTYYPLPEENAYWTVIEFDWSNGEYNDIVYTVDGDTTFNNLNYKKIYRLDDYPTIYDTVSTLHCFMRQNVEEKKIWFIRHYLGEILEKLGYDLSVEVGDTVSLPAFHFGEFGDSLFYLQYIDSVDLDFVGELYGYRKFYFFVPVQNSGMGIGYIEGIIEQRFTFPILDNFYGYNAFYQSETECLQVNDSYWFGMAGENLPPEEYCGFLAVDVESNEFVNNLKVFPNPASDLITVQLADTFINPGILTIYNNFGETVLIREISGSPKSFAIDVSNFINGIYFLSVNSNSTTRSTKFIVIH